MPQNNYRVGHDGFYDLSYAEGDGDSSSIVRQMVPFSLACAVCTPPPAMIRARPASPSTGRARPASP
jgi:hypothetical protein